MLSIEEKQKEKEIMQSLQRLKMQSLRDFKFVEDYIHKLSKNKQDGDE